MSLIKKIAFTAAAATAAIAAYTLKGGKKTKAKAVAHKVEAKAETVVKQAKTKAKSAVRKTKSKAKQIAKQA